MSSFYGGGSKPWVHSNCAGDLRELLRVPLRSQGYCGAGTPLSGLHWVSCNGRKPLYLIGERNGNPLQCSCLENPMDGGAWWATVHGVAKSRTRLSNFTFFLSIVSFGGGNGNPLQCSCLENPMDGGAWWAAVYGVAKSQTRLSN